MNNKYAFYFAPNSMKIHMCEMDSMRTVCGKDLTDLWIPTKLRINMCGACKERYCSHKFSRFRKKLVMTRRYVYG